MGLGSLGISQAGEDVPALLGISISAGVQSCPVLVLTSSPVEQKVLEIKKSMIQAGQWRRAGRKTPALPLHGWGTPLGIRDDEMGQRGLKC